MMKIKWIALLSFGLIVAQAQAETPVVIDNQAIGNAPADTKAESTSTVQTKTQSDDAAARERIRLGGKVSTRERAQLVKEEIGETNKTEGESFLARNGAKQGVITLPSGVQYRVIRASKGKTPTEASRVMCRYTGTLINGMTFDKTEKRPALLSVSGFLPGLKEAVTRMSPGSKWEIVIPPQLAYGATGNKGVGPNAVVIYQMEIVSIK